MSLPITLSSRYHSLRNKIEMTVGIRSGGEPGLASVSADGEKFLGRGQELQSDAVVNGK